MMRDDDYRIGQSPDDALEETRSEGISMQEQMPLEEDNDRPAAPPRNPYDPPLPLDHPATDSNLDPGELYDRGLEYAARPQAEPRGLLPDPFGADIQSELTEEEAFGSRDPLFG